MIELYNGKIKLDFDKKTHRYTVHEAEDEQLKIYNVFSVPSVTQILGILDKPALIQWAANSTCDYLRGKIVAGQSYDEIQIDEMFNDARFNFRRISRTAKSVGSLVHEWIEKFIKNIPMSDYAGFNMAEICPLPFNEQAAKGCKAAMQWMGQMSFEPLEPEVKLYSLRRRVAGTMDWPARINGKLAIVDWKTSKGIYDEMIIQVDTYASIYEEMTGQKVQESWIVRVDKETGDVEPMCLETERKKKGLNPRAERKANFKMFLALKVAYERMQVIKNGGKATEDVEVALKKSLQRGSRQIAQAEHVITA